MRIAEWCRSTPDCGGCVATLGTVLFRTEVRGRVRRRVHRGNGILRSCKARIWNMSERATPDAEGASLATPGNDPGFAEVSSQRSSTREPSKIAIFRTVVKNNCTSAILLQHIYIKLLTFWTESIHHTFPHWRLRRQRC
jgi:hypothetical protein